MDTDTDNNTDNNTTNNTNNTTDDYEEMVLPIRTYEREIVQAVRDNAVVIILGETGSGKTTQLSQILFANIDKIIPADADDDDCDDDCDDDDRERRTTEIRRRRRRRSRTAIAITQPRRVAAISVARRVAKEMNETIDSGIVGYSVRFDDRTTKKTKIKYLTDGMLLREILSDKRLMQYSIVVLDEAHERSVNTDVLFGVLKKLSSSSEQRGLKVIVTSATLDAEKFSKYFNNCPILSVPGRNYPVKISHALERPIGKTAYFDCAIDTVLQIHETAKVPGDILLFLTGKAEIDIACKIIDERIKEIKEKNTNKVAQIIPLYAALTPEMQARVFSKIPKGLETTCRRIVVATNIAETSLTVPGIVYVVDPGVVKLKRYDAATGIETLEVEQISKVQATQRAGRAGRTQAGKCYRLYTKENFQIDFANATEPEIQRTSLVNVVLYLKSLELENMDVLKFDFLDKPKVEALIDALKQLYVLDAIDEDGKITNIGREMAPLPLEPNLARAMLEAKKLGCVEECATIAAMLSVDKLEVLDHNNKRGGGAGVGRNQQQNPLQKIVSDEVFALGDHIVFLRTFERWQRERFRRDFAREFSLSERGLEFAKDVRKQLINSMRSNTTTTNDDSTKKRKEDRVDEHDRRGHNNNNNYYKNNNRSERSRTKDVRKALAKGFISKIARRGTSSNCFKTYSFETKTLTEVHPSSARALADEDGLLPDWIIYHELMMTSRPFLKHVCRIEYEWIENELPRLENPINVNRLSGGVFSFDGPSENNEQMPTPLLLASASASASAATTAEDKVNEARKRFLARKKMKNN